MGIAAIEFRRNARFASVALWFLIAPVFVLGPSVRAQDANTLKRQFLDDAPRRWLEYREFVARLQGKMAFKWQRDGKTESVWTAVVKQNSTCKLVSKQTSLTFGKSRESAAGQVWAFNPNYNFTLRRGGADDSWALEDLQIIKGSKISSSAVDNANRVTGGLAILTRIVHTELQDLVQQPSFRVLSVKKLIHLEAESVVVEFDNPHPLNTEGQFIPIQGGTFILDPSRSWCVRAYAVRTKYGDGDGKTSAETTSRDSKSKFPIPLRRVETREYVDSGNVRIVQEEREFDLVDPDEFPDYGEFTLTAFGLPEPMGMPPVNRGIRWYIWLSLAAAGAVAIGFLFAKVKRRYSTAEPVKA